MMNKWRAVFVVFFFFLLSLLFLHPINAGDFFHHLNTGRYIVQHLSLPYTDDLTFTAYGKPWVAHSWGAGLIFYIIYSLAGPTGISVLFAFLGSLTALFLFLTLQKLKVPLLISLPLVFCAASIISLRWPTRPEVLGPLFMIALVYLLTSLKPEKHLSFKKILILPFFFWLWGIIYGSSAFLGIGVLVFYFVTRVKLSKQILGIILGSFIASLLNGYGPASFLYIFQIPNIAPHVGEWLPLHYTMNKDIPELVLFYQYIVLCYLLFTFLYVLLCALGILTQRKNLFAHVFLLGISLAVFAPFYTNRFINLGPLLATPIMGIILVHLGKNLKRVFVFVVLAIAFSATIARFYIFSFGTGIEQSPFQSKITSFLTKHQVNGNIFATQEIGAFLSWELPSSKVFVDTRDDLFMPGGTFEELQALGEGKTDILTLLNKYNADIVVGDLANGGSYKPLFYSPSWRFVFLTDGFFIAIREHLAQQAKLPTLTALDPLRIPPVKPGLLEKAEEEMERLVQDDPKAIENQVRRIEIKLALGKNIEAKNILSSLDLGDTRGAKQAVYEMENDLLRAKVALANKECSEAFRFLQKADALHYHQLLFFPNTVLPSPIDRYYGDYYLVCTKDKEKAREYYMRYLQNNNNPIERLQIERQLNLP